MDIEDEEDEVADSQNTTADQDVLEASMNSQGQGEEGAEGEDGGGEPRGAGLQKTEEHLESEEALELS